MKNKKNILLLTALAGLMGIVLLLEALNIINLYHKNPTLVTPGPTAEQKQQEADINADAKKQFIDENSPGNTSTPTNETANKSIELSAMQEANNTVTVFTKLFHYSDGNCELTVVNGAKTTTQTAPIIYQPEFASCAGFGVPIDLVGKGTWTITLMATSKGTTETKTISFEVK
jgi:hypothetical protein